MRTLIVDNYDSFTYNLAHYVAQATGYEPVVVTNDDPLWRPGHWAEFDSIIISPGPGTPERQADFGICRDIIRDSEVPLLGVCLGHQGLAHVHGGTVERAPEPRHGRSSPVLHVGTGIFTGLPSPFEVVRYHSLTVSALPDRLEATAWTPDGILMGLRHRTRPQWGVQFHPESICTEHGHRLLANFMRWADRCGHSRHHRGKPSAAVAGQSVAIAHAPEASSSGLHLRVHTIALPTQWEPEMAYDHLFRAASHSYWLDSSRPDDRLGRFSVMGDATGPLAEVVLADVENRTVTRQKSDGTNEVLSTAFLDWLDADLRARRVDVPELPFEFALGWVGYLGYELKAECGGDAAHSSPDPDGALIFADRAVVFDHATSTTHLLALAPADDDTQARAWLEATAERLSRLKGLRADATAAGPGAAVEVSLRHDRHTYLDLIGACHEAINAGETYEVCLTNMIDAEDSIDPWGSYRFLRCTSPAPFAALLNFGTLSVLSTSPERFLRIDRHKIAESKPIKGTRPRCLTPVEDRALAEDLLASEKDRAENLMIVDLVRNDLGRCAEVGSVTVHQMFDVESYATVHQLVSTVRARLKADSSAVDCVRNTFPGGSMTGAPKIRTMRIIDELEGGPRGIYSGAIGYFSLNGATDLSIAIRTTVITPDRVRYGVGSAITTLSNPEEEYEEIAVKATPILRLLGTTFPERALRTSGL
ncbi:aminodeoxychorismate synthase component I [Streptomyces abikoensis]|uniref:aminodeoxychorismate synthase component I n=1 Tax=Streptomyces abikoensis TaxID=97398 RepID=UPI00167A65CB|nr:aminodeoxychorismate synthase component I [Streptomyces abikoensis]GGP46702.1 aminodeoxychorismate synthase, component I [Streptomyces abikoensis]